MKKLICMFTIMVLCCSCVFPAFAANGLFVPSIDYKPNPDIDDPILGEEDVTGCLVITSILQAQEKSTDIYQSERDLLLDVYGKLSDGSMTLPIEKEYVIRELLDVSFKVETCRENKHGHAEKLAEEGITLSVDFDLGVNQDAQIVVMTYINGVWEPIESVAVNKDGTVTCVFEDICPVAFCVVEEGTIATDTGDRQGQQILWWIALLVLSMTAFVVLTYLHRRKRF